MPSISSRQPGPSAECVEVEPGRFRYSMWKNLSIGVWQDQANRDAAERVVAMSQRNAAQFPHGHSGVVFIMTGAPAPTPEAAEILGSLYKPGSTALRCIGLVLEGEGFWASAMRSTVLNMRLSHRSKMSVRVMEDVDAVAAWLPTEHVRLTGVELDPKTLRTVLLETRAIGTKR